MTRLNSAPTTLRAICVHGAGAGGWEWNVWIRVLGAYGIDARAPDLCLHPGGLAQTSFSHYREQVVRWVADAASDVGGVVVIGASLGGLLALSIAAQARVVAAILINPMPPLGVIAKPLGEPFPRLIPWGSERSFAGTRRAMPDANAAATLYAFRRWRDESGIVLEQARGGIAIEAPACPLLVLASSDGDDVPPIVSRALAVRYAADHERLEGCSHLGPMLGTRAAEIAERSTQWLLRRTMSLA